MNKLLTGLLLSLFYCTSAQADFDGLYAANIWAVGGPSGNSDGVVDVVGTPGFVTLISNDIVFIMRIRISLLSLLKTQRSASTGRVLLLIQELRRPIVTNGTRSVIYPARRPLTSVTIAVR
jgi:hypothetical protein